MKESQFNQEKKKPFSWWLFGFGLFAMPLGYWSRLVSGPLPQPEPRQTVVAMPVKFELQNWYHQAMLVDKSKSSKPEDTVLEISSSTIERDTIGNSFENSNRVNVVFAAMSTSGGGPMGFAKQKKKDSHIANTRPVKPLKATPGTHSDRSPSRKAQPRRELNAPARSPSADSRRQDDVIPSETVVALEGLSALYIKASRIATLICKAHNINPQPTDALRKQLNFIMKDAANLGQRSSTENPETVLSDIEEKLNLTNLQLDTLEGEVTSFIAEPVTLDSLPRRLTDALERFNQVNDQGAASSSPSQATIPPGSQNDPEERVSVDLNEADAANSANEGDEGVRAQLVSRDDGEEGVQLVLNFIGNHADEAALQIQAARRNDLFRQYGLVDFVDGNRRFVSNPVIPSMPEFGPHVALPTVKEVRGGLVGKTTAGPVDIKKIDPRIIEQNRHLVLSPSHLNEPLTQAERAKRDKIFLENECPLCPGVYLRGYQLDNKFVLLYGGQSRRAMSLRFAEHDYILRFNSTIGFSNPPTFGNNLTEAIDVASLLKEDNTRFLGSEIELYMGVGLADAIRGLRYSNQVKSVGLIAFQTGVTKEVLDPFEAYVIQAGSMLGKVAGREILPLLGFDPDSRYIFINTLSMAGDGPSPEFVKDVICRSAEEIEKIPQFVFRKIYNAPWVTTVKQLMREHHNIEDPADSFSETTVRLWFSPSTD